MWLMIFLISVHFVDTEIYLWKTEDDRSSQSFDCFYLNSLFYCRRPTDPIDLHRTNEFSTCNEIHDGVTHRFSELRSRNITITTILHQWKSSFEQVEKYWRFLNEKTSVDDFICQCQQENTFGKYCEYRLPVGLTFDETYEWQMKIQSKNPWQIQQFGNLTCYEGLRCDSGLLCLDWREICDGVQNCLLGFDEKNCDILELNICDDDEYRCSNGMCIPGEFFLDGIRDCLDWTDELAIKTSQFCARAHVSVECDDHICLTMQWPCGDGQCIDNRMSFTRDLPLDQCLNRRDQYRLCELHGYLWLWTMPNGRCYGAKPFVDQSIKIKTNEDLCHYLLRCALSHGAENSCPCDFGDDTCFIELFQKCSGSIIQYKTGAALAPFLSIHFIVNDEEIDYFGLINGTMKCRNLFIPVTGQISQDDFAYFPKIVDEFFCKNVSSMSSNVTCFDPEETKDVCHQWNPCRSKTRISDGYFDCFNRNDEINQTTCVRRHRFRCSNEQNNCLTVSSLGDGKTHCKNLHDEKWFTTNRRLSEMRCHEISNADCSLVRRYVEQSSVSTRKNNVDLFRSFCNTFWDFESKHDENVSECQQFWVCSPDQWRCNTGQCIDPTWVKDNEWDCADGSDEIENNIVSTELLRIYEKNQTSINHSDPFSCLNHNNYSFVCLSLTQQRWVCLHPHQMGDNQIDCLGAFDERNTLSHCSSSSSMLGHEFLCLSTNTCIPYFHHCQPNYRCPNPKDDALWCERSKRPINCDETNDFVCFRGYCMKNRRCDRVANCGFNEDEYMCDYASHVEEYLVPYRETKRVSTAINTHVFSLPVNPFDASITELDFDNTSFPRSINATVFNESVTLSAYVCNRGLGIFLSNDSIVCFCPPQYYGEFCQYHSDRLLILLHLNLSQSEYTYQTNPSIGIKLLVLLLFNDQVLMTHVFHVRPALDLFTIVKKTIHFPYLRTTTFRQHRQNRFENRSDIISSHPYAIRIEAYEMDMNERLTLKAVWQYPIIFDYLPVFRFSKILHLKRDFCSNRPCSRNAQCFPLMNNKSNHLCLCKPDFSGVNCTIRDEQCSKGFCASKSLCKPDYRSLSRGNVTPFCLCPQNRYGDRCEIIHDYCEVIPCFNNGSCYPNSQPNSVTCLCTKEYHGSRCELKNAHVFLSVINNEKIQRHGVVIQYFTIDSISLNLILIYQQVFPKFPRSIEYFHRAKVAPEIVVAKMYRSLEDPSFDLHLLSSSTNVTSIEGTIDISDVNHCAFIQLTSPLRYHRICIENRPILCFRDSIYLCLCTYRHKRVECFAYDEQLDHCTKCSSGGHCLRGNHPYSNDFLCLCPTCYSGRQCQFNSKSFAFTLDQLLYTDLTSSNKERTIVFLILFSTLGFLFAIPNNLFSFVTFKQRSCLRNGIGYYLLCLSFINQINLTLFLIRFVHLVTNMIDGTSPSLIDEILCRLLSYLMTCSNRLVYWFSSMIAIERVYMTLFINGQWLKQPHIARRLIVIVILMILSVHCYQLIFYTTFFDSDGIRRTICVFQYPIGSQALWSILHPWITMIDSLLPFVINLSSTLTISVIVIRNKMNMIRKETSQSSRWNKLRSRFHLVSNVLSENKELVLGPAIALLPQLFSLPLLITAFVLHCQTLENSWLRYLLIVSYWASLTPQTISFFLYIRPSSFYSNEWRKSKLGRWIYSTMRWQSQSPMITTTAQFTVLSRRLTSKINNNLR